MTSKEYKVLSSDGKTELHTFWWAPEKPIKAILQIVHGVAEHAARYKPFAEFLTENGVAVLAHDHLGHGRSETAQKVPVYFGDNNSWKTVTDDIAAVADSVNRDFVGTPFFVLGHSMGSFLLRSFLIRYPQRKLAGAIVMGTGWQGSLKLSGGLAIATHLAKKGPAKSSDFVNNLAFGAYNKPFKPNRTAFDWLSADTENVASYISDPLCGAPATVGLFREMLSGIKFNQNHKNIRLMNKVCPILLVSGKNDPVGDMGKGVEKTYYAFKVQGLNCTMKLYPNLRHEILNEKSNQGQVFQDILDWMEARY